MKYLLSILFIFTFNFSTYAQSVKSNYYFVTEDDTVFCSRLEFELNWLGNLSALEYTDMDGKMMEFFGTDTVPEVLTFYMNGVTLDNIPLKANRPQGRKIFTERIIDGPIKVYYSNEGSTIPTGHNKTFKFTISERFFIQLPDGEFYDLRSKKSRQKVLNPFLNKCSKYKDLLSGAITNDMENIKKRIKQYNSVCN